MAVLLQLSKLKLDQFTRRFRGESIPLGTSFSYFCAATPLGDDDRKEYLEEPIAALPPAISSRLPRILICLVPYLEMAAVKSKKKNAGDQIVSMDKPDANKQLAVARMVDGGQMILAFGIKDQELADYHYHFYRSIATLVADKLTTVEWDKYLDLLGTEFEAEAHGEVDESSWDLKEQLTALDLKFKRTLKPCIEYAKQSLIDTLTLYLHGICCDIDVEPGPRQLRTSFLRKRLQLFKSLFAPGEGFSVFPEDEKN